MKKLFAFLAFTGMIALAWTCNHESKTGGPGIYNPFCNSSSPDELCSHIPYDVNETFTLGYDSFLDSLHQIPFDVFSWQTFIALNWPSDSSGNPQGGSLTSSGAPRVWEHYTDPAVIFGHSNPSLVFQLEQAGRNGQKFFYMDAKAPLPLLPNNTIDMSELSHNKLKGFLEADGHPLIDRNLNFALYEIKINPVETLFIKSNGLSTLQGIYDYATRSSVSSIDLPASDSATGNAGSMEIKASWRILIPALGDDTTRYYCRRATIYIDSMHTRNRQPLLLTNVQVGLVGMHIIRKTAKVSANEIWTTFEHIDNTPDDAQQAQQSDRQWSFYKPACLNCTPNNVPDTIAGDGGRYIWETTMPYARQYAVQAPGQQLDDSFGTQVVRTYPIYKYTDMVNQLWQTKLKGMVWANYRLIGTQWKQSEVTSSPTAPNFLANTTLETYIQADASCISCHNQANIIYKNDTIGTDLSFLFPVYAK